MSAGGVFKLIANDGKADRMIMATKLLNQRINDVMCARRRAGQADPTPTLVDLERTHILFVNAHFKPFAAIGYEYNKVRPQSGSPTLGNSVTFSIPQFGDFFHDMVGRQVLSSFSSSTQTAPSQGVPGFPENERNWDNAVSPALPGASYSLVDAFGNAVTPGSGSFQNLVRYCQFPGERLYQNVKFDVNGNPLDEYNETTIVMLRKFTIGADKILGYSKLVGQGIPREGMSGPKIGNVSNTGYMQYANGGEAASNVMGNVHNAVAADEFVDAADYEENQFPWQSWSLTTSSKIKDVYCDSYTVVNGPQTPKYTQPALEIWNKLRFWFNDDPRLSIASVSIPYGQRFITIDLAAQNLLAFEFPGLYVKQTIITSEIEGSTAASENYVTTEYRPWYSPGTISEITLSGIELYVNNIFVNPEVHDIYIKRIGFSLIRVYRRQLARTNTEGGHEQQLTQLKWPIEYMFVGLRPSVNVATQNAMQWRDWHHMCKVYSVLQDNATNVETALSDLNYAFSHMGQVVPDTYAAQTTTFETISVTAHGISIHDNFPQKFFNAYVPFHYGGSAIVTPSDEGAIMINFALYPRSIYQPSGHINLSRAREFYIKWTTGYVSPTTPADLHVVAIAINFLLITDGSAVLRYST